MFRLFQKIYETGPVVISILASADFYMYQSGLFTDTNCDNPIGYFAMSIVGYGATNKREHWNLKYSMGTFWGIDGYMRLPIRSDNTYCGVRIKAIWMTFDQKFGFHKRKQKDF